MIINIVIFLLSIPLYLLSTFASLANAVFPLWLTVGINNIMGGTGILNTIFPMYPHVGMAGLAGSLGIMTIFGWAVTLMGYLIILSIGFKLIRILFGLLPWHTGGVNIKTGGH